MVLQKPSVPAFANTFPLYVTLYQDSMRYALFEIVKQDLVTAEQIGLMIELELERLKYHTCLPTSADWGYVFSIKINKRRYDISIVKLNQKQFGLAIEYSSNLFDKVFSKTRNDQTMSIQSWIDDILAVDVVVTRIEWYSQDTWISNFNQEYWTYVNR